MQAFLPMYTRLKRNKTVHVITLGCSKNTVDSEYLLRQLEENGFKTMHDTSHEHASVVIINTCGFILDAKQESIDTILRFAGAREKGQINKLMVIGCLSQRYGEQLKREIPAVDAYFGVDRVQEVVETLGGQYKQELTGERHLTTPSHYAYLKISEGCDRHCAFCSIPLIRGRHVSNPVEYLIREAEYLAHQGVKELILIAQDLSYYGIDLYGKPMLPFLLEKLIATGHFNWLRLHYLFPKKLPLRILDIMRDNGNICHYIDIPFQHIADPVLRKMRRGINARETRQLIYNIRRKVPGIHIRTTMMVGHPGETDKDFQELLDFVKETRFERLGAFIYSHEEDTFAFKKYKDRIPLKVKKARFETLMDLQRDISNELNNSKLGQVFKVLIDRREGGHFAGRTEYDSPEIDNEVLVRPASTPLKPGQFCEVRITGADDFDLQGEVT